MATTVVLAPEADAAARGDGLGAGQGNHLPAGTWSGVHYRAGIRFALPAGWSGATKITSATLSVYTTDFQHVGPVNSAIYVRRQLIGSLWLKAEGSQSCESGFSAGNTTQYTDLAATASDQVSFSSGSNANYKRSATVTAAVEYMRANGYSKLVFVLDGATSSDVSEFWSSEHGSTYDASLSITYETASPPNAPTLVAPAANAVVTSQTPTFQWVHNPTEGDPQTGADIDVYDDVGPTIYHLHPVNPTDLSLVIATVLTRGQTYHWQARTYDTSGPGAWSAMQDFTVQAIPVVTISPTRVMAFDAVNHQPRLVVNWTTSVTQTDYRVQTASGYDSGILPGSVQSFTIPRNLVNGTAETVTVTVNSGFPGSASQAFTPRWGLTTHRKDLGSAPITWGNPNLNSTVPAGSSLVIEYGSDPAANAAPASGWFNALSAVPLNRYVFWRGWFIPSATASPVLDALTIPANLTVTLVDKWATTRDTNAFVAPWKVDPGEAVYGTRSMRCDVSGAGPFYAYSAPIKLRAGRNYILTGLMKSQGNSGAQFMLMDAGTPPGNSLQGGGMSLPSGPVQSQALVATTDWFDATKRDTNRYRTPVYVAAADMTVYVVLKTGGAAGSTAWFDAIKLEESSVATPWSPGALGAVVIDAGGVQIDGSAGGVFRYRGISGGARDTVEGGASALLIGGDTELASPATGVLSVGGAQLARISDIPAPYVPASSFMGQGSTASQGSITTAVDLAGSAVTWTVIAGHTYKVEYGANVVSTVATDVMGLRLMEGAAVLDQMGVDMAAISRVNSGARSYIAQGLSAGAHTLKLNAQRNNGTGTLSVSSAYIIVTDLG